MLKAAPPFGTYLNKLKKSPNKLGYATTKAHSAELSYATGANAERPILKIQQKGGHS